MPLPRVLAIIELGAHQFQASAGDPIRAAAFRGDGASPFQFAKQQQVQARGPPTLPVDADDAVDFPIFTAFDFNSPTLREQMKDALFSARNVHCIEYPIVRDQRALKQTDPMIGSELRSVSGPATRRSRLWGLYRVSDRLNIKSPLGGRHTRQARRSSSAFMAGPGGALFMAGFVDRAQGFCRRNAFGPGFAAQLAAAIAAHFKRCVADAKALLIGRADQADHGVGGG